MPLSLPGSMSWIVRSIKRSEKRRGLVTVSNHDMERIQHVFDK
jgi:hypothetical protein